MPKIRNLQVGLRVWSRGEIFSKKMNKKWRAHKPPPPIITDDLAGRKYTWAAIHYRHSQDLFIIPILH